MYQGMQQNQPQAQNGYGGNIYQNANPYVYGAQYQQRYMPMEQTLTGYPSSPTGSYIKGRPVVSIEEARATSIDLDGSLYVFTDIGNKKIYTKQINLDGTATLNVYSLQEEDSVESSSEYVTKMEFNQALSQIQTMFNNISTQYSNPIKKDEDNKKPTSLNSF